jgi:hypothetical protein
VWLPSARIFCECSGDPIPVEEYMFQRQLGLNSVLDLMEGEAEFTPPAIPFAAKMRRWPG